jgi:dynein heavy chain
LDLFIRDKEKTLIRDVRKGDYLNLVFMMGQLASVREKTSFYDNMFDPIKNKIELLKSYGQEVSDDVYERLNRLPEKWNDVKKLAMQAKQKVAPLQADEVNNIRKKIASFEVEQFNFREAFKQEAPFIYGSKDPYELLYKVQYSFYNIYIPKNIFF